MADKDTSLGEKIIVLLVGAVVTSLAVPLVLFFVQGWWNDRQKLYEADLARQSALMDDQDSLLKNLQHKLYDFRIGIVKPAWYKYRLDDPARFKSALAEFENESWKFHVSMHEELTNVRRLASSEAYNELKYLYDKLSQLDLRLVALSTDATASLHDWEQLHRDANEVASDIQAVVIRLAQDFRLKPFEDVHNGPPVAEAAKQPS